MADKERRADAPDLEESDAEAPGPITPEHESGSWEQTLKQQEAREKYQEALRGKGKEKSDKEQEEYGATPRQPTGVVEQGVKPSGKSKS